MGNSINTISPSDALILIGLFLVGLVLLASFAIVFVFGIKIIRMKVVKEVGLLKTHMAYHPAKPKKQYTIKP
jgi:hypothetical protein